MRDLIQEIEIQRRYYAETAAHYTGMHINERDEHSFALSFMMAALNYLEIKSVLDIGSGTGRALQLIKRCRPDLKILGIEPVPELRQIGYQNGLTEAELIAGDATNLNLNDGEFDLVCEFGVLHHIRKPEVAIDEMLRVAQKGIFISDSNNFGQGFFLARSFKQLINACGLWQVVDFIKTKGKGYTISEGDGLAYSYSIFNNYKQIKHSCKAVHLLNTKDGEINFYKTASHVALLGIKK